jgi:hypothetical protein
MRVHVVCPVCHESLEYEHVSTTGDAYGTIAIDDWAIAELTIQDGDGSVREHMNSHTKDGSFEKAYTLRLKGEVARAEFYFKSRETP